MILLPTIDDLLDDVLDELGGFKTLSLSPFISAAFQAAIDSAPIDLTAVRTPLGLYECLRIPNCAAAPPGWFESTMAGLTESDCISTTWLPPRRTGENTYATSRVSLSA